jgi:metal-responsive CopG/Arc/MetJ family transcriptional regulator
MEVFCIPEVIFIDMKKMTKHLRIRMTEEQFKKLADVLVEEQKSKSTVIRDALQMYLGEHNNRNGSQKENIKAII